MPGSSGSTSPPASPLREDEFWPRWSTARLPASWCRTPSFFGEVRDYSGLARVCHEAGALLVVVVTEILSLGAVRRPAKWAPISSPRKASRSAMRSISADLYVGLFATRDKFVRQMPGRLVGQTADADGRRGWVLTLSTREQHIRRERATSNICTNSGLCALAFTIHLVAARRDRTDPAGAPQSRRSRRARRAARAMPGLRLVNRAFFNEFALRLPASGRRYRRNTRRQEHSRRGAGQAASTRTAPS